MRLCATKPRSGEQVEREIRATVCQTKSDDEVDVSAAGTLSLLAFAVAGHQPNFQGEAGDYDSSVE